MPEFDFTSVGRFGPASTARHFSPQSEESPSRPLLTLKDAALFLPRGVEGAASSIYGFADTLLGDALPNWGGENTLFGHSESTIGGIAEGITQFAAGFALTGVGAVGRALGGISTGLKSLGVGAKAASYVGLAARGAATDFLAFDGHDERLSNLIQAVPALRNPVTEYLSASANDGEIEGRIKNVLEGIGLDPIVGTVVAGLKAIRAFHGEAARLKAAGTFTDKQIGEAARKVAYGDPELVDRALDGVLGPPDAPPKPKPPRVPQDVPVFKDILGEGGEHSSSSQPKPVMEALKARMDERAKAADEGVLSKRELDKVLPAVTPEDAAIVKRFMDRVGPGLFDETRLAFSDFGKDGEFNFATSVVKIGNAAIRDGEFARTALHELWHSLERNVSPERSAKLKRQFELERAKVIKAGGALGEKVASGGWFRVSELEAAGVPRSEAKKIASQSYRYSSLQEWWAETLTDKTLSKFAQEAEIESASGFKRVWLAGKAFLGEVFAALGSKFGANHAQTAFREFMSGKGSVTVQNAYGLGAKNRALADLTNPDAVQQVQNYIDARKKVIAETKKFDSSAPPGTVLQHPEDAETILNAAGAGLEQLPLNLRHVEQAGGVVESIRAVEAAYAKQINEAVESASTADRGKFLEQTKDMFLDMVGSVKDSAFKVAMGFAESVPNGIQALSKRLLVARSFMVRAERAFSQQLEGAAAGIRDGTISNEDLGLILYYLTSTAKFVVGIRKSVREVSRFMRSLTIDVGHEDFNGIKPGAPEPITVAPEATPVAPEAPKAPEVTKAAPEAPAAAPAATEATEAALPFDGGFEGGGKAQGATKDPNALPFDGGFEGGGKAQGATKDPNALPFDGGFEGGGKAQGAAADPNALPFTDTLGHGEIDPRSEPLSTPHPTEAKPNVPTGEKRAVRRTAQILKELGMTADDVTKLIDGLGGRGEALKTLNRLLLVTRREGKLAGVLTEAAGHLKNTGDSLSLIREVEKAGKPRYKDAFIEWYMNAILSGPRTLATNVLSGMIGSVWRPLELMLGAIPAAVYQKSVAPILAPFDHMIGLASAVGDAWKLAYASLKDASPRLSQFESGSAIGVRDAAITEEILPANLQGTLVGSAMNAFGTLVRTPTRVLQATDELFSQLNYRADATVSLMREARAAGLRGQEITRFVAEKMEVLVRDGHALSYGRVFKEAEAAIRSDPRYARLDDDAVQKLAGLHAAEKWEELGKTPLVAIGEEARNTARDLTFTAPLNKNAGGFEGVAAYAQQLVSAHPMLRVFVPFIRTPTNILLFAGRRIDAVGVAQTMLNKVSRGKLFNEATHAFQRDIAAGGLKAQQAIGRLTMGAGTIFALMSMTDRGKLTGSGPRDKDHKQTLRAAGWQPYSVKVGNQYVSYSRLDPLSTVVGIAADMMDVLRRNPDADGETITEAISALGIALANNFTQKSYLMGFASFIDAMQDPEMNLTRIMQRMAASATVPNFVAQAAGSQDPYLRQIRSYADEIINKTFASDSLEERRDIFGKPIKRSAGLGADAIGEWLTAVTPFEASTISDDPVRVEMARLRRGFAVPKPEYGGIDLRSIKDSSGKSAYDRWMRNHQTVRINGLGIEEAVKRLVQSRDYGKLPDFLSEGLDSPKAAAINAILNKYRRAAYTKTLKELPALAFEDRRIREARARS